MRYEKLWLIALLFSFYACDDQNSLSKLSGTYSGVLVEVKQSLLNGNLSSTEVDSIPIQLEIINQSFKRIGQNLTCPGEVVVEGGKVIFDSSDCNCLCACSPFEICDGDIMLGEYEHRWSANTLILNYEMQKDTLQLIGQDFLGFRHLKTFELVQE